MTALEKKVQALIRSEANQRGGVPSYDTIKRIIKKQWKPTEYAGAELKPLINKYMNNAGSSFKVELTGEYVAAMIKQGLPFEKQQLKKVSNLVTIWTRILKHYNGYASSKLLFKELGGRRADFLFIKEQLLAWEWFEEIEAGGYGVVARYDLGKKHPKKKTLQVVLPKDPNNAWENISFPIKRKKTNQ
jgi:hypothetical protein